MSVRRRVREVFLQPQEFYGLTEAAELLSWSFDETRRAVSDGDLEAERTCSGFRIPWQEVAAMITAQYPQAAIEHALGRDVSAVMPELVRLTEIRVAIPRYEVVMLGKLAERENLTIAEFLSRHLLDLAGSEIDWLNGVVPEFSAAMNWPER
jgi:hypothetical protein